jgi:hypothetical protein
MKLAWSIAGVLPGESNEKVINELERPFINFLQQTLGLENPPEMTTCRWYGDQRD